MKAKKSIVAQAASGACAAIIANAPAIARAIALATASGAEASAEKSSANAALWNALKDIESASKGMSSDFDVHALAFASAGFPEHSAITLRETGKAPKNWKSALNRASEIRTLRAAGYSVLEKLPAALVFPDALDSDACMAYEIGEARSATQSEARKALATLAALEQAALDAARQRLYPASLDNRADWTEQNIPALYEQFALRAIEFKRASDSHALMAKNLESALQGDKSADSHAIVIASLNSRLAERDEQIRVMIEEVNAMRQRHASASASAD